MALIGLNVTGDRITGSEAIGPALGDLPHGRSVTVLTHGFRHSPLHPDTDPHTHILSFAPRDCWKAVSWPRHLHLHRDGSDLGIALGWHATGRLPRVAARAQTVGTQLAKLIAEIRQLRPDLRVNLMAHSLGARVALAALRGAPAGSIGRVILLTGAEYRDSARAAMDSPAGRSAEVLNVISRENTPFDLMFRFAAPPARPTERTLCAGLSGQAGWTDLRIDCPSTRADLKSLGFRVAPPATRICHWSAYLRPGLFPLYRRVLDRDDRQIMPKLAALTATPATRTPSDITPVPQLAAGA